MGFFNTVVRIGIDASGFAAGLGKLKKDFKAASQQMANESAALSVSQKVAKAQPGTTVNDRVGSILHGATPLITQPEIENIAEARRQAQDLAAAMTKLEAKGAAARGATDADAEKYWRLKGMYENVAEAIGIYERSLEGAKAAQKAEADAALENARAESLVAEQQNSSATSSRILGSRFASLKSHASSLSSKFKSLQATDEECNRSMKRLSTGARFLGRALSKVFHISVKIVKLPYTILQKGAHAIKSIGNAAKNSQGGLGRMVRSLRNISLMSIGISLAGAAFGRLRSIVSDYISSNAELQAQVNGLKAGLGQALAPAIGLVVNLFSRLMPYVLGVANAIGRLFGMLFGNAFGKAATGAKQLAAGTGSAAKAQKELNNQLLGFDQLNRLEGQNEDNSGGGGGGGGGSAVAPIEAKTPAWMERLKTSFSDLFNSDEFKAANIGGKLGMSLQRGLDWLGGEAMNFNWNGVGKKLRENWDSFWNSGAVESFGRTVGIVFAGIGDMVIGFLGPTWDEMGQAWKQHGLLGIGLYVWGMTLAGEGKLVSGFFTRLLSPMFQGMADFFREHGHQSLAGFFQGLADKTQKIGENIKKYFVDPIVNWVKKLLGIHSPSTVFADIAGYCVEGFTQRFEALKKRITDKFDGIRSSVTGVVQDVKNAFRFNWQLPQLKLPHIQVGWQEAGSVLSKFLGISHIPNLSVQWFAKGGIMDGAQIFGASGGKLLGGGEAGREAVLPLERNTGWMDDIAARVVKMLGDTGDVNVTIPIYLDGKLISTEVLRRLRSQARRDGQPAWG